MQHDKTGKEEQYRLGIVEQSCHWRGDQGGFLREVLPEVKYQPPPEGLKLRWEQDEENSKNFRLRFDSPPIRIYSFRQLCGKLQQNASQWQKLRCGTPQLPAALKRLDQITQKILDLTNYLHQNRWGVGFLAPENIIIFEWDEEFEEFEVFFSDLGFYWDSEVNPAPPEWLRPASKGNEYAYLWEDKDPKKQQDRGRPQPETSFDPKPDIQTLGKIFMSALLGGFFEKVPPSDHFPQTVAQASHIPHARRIWVTLQQAVEGKFSSVVEFGEQLNKTPLSQHFLRDAPSGLLWKRRAALGGMVVMGIVILAVLGLLGRDILAVLGLLAPVGPRDGTEPPRLIAKTSKQPHNAEPTPSQGPSPPLEFQFSSLAENLQKFAETLNQFWGDYRQSPVGNYFEARDKCHRFWKEFKEYQKKLEEFQEQNTSSTFSSEEVQKCMKLYEQCRLLLERMALEFGGAPR